MDDSKKQQINRFKEAARQLECDDDQKRFDEKLGKMVKQQPEKEENGD